MDIGAGLGCVDIAGLPMVVVWCGGGVCWLAAPAARPAGRVSHPESNHVPSTRTVPSRTWSMACANNKTFVWLASGLFFLGVVVFCLFVTRGGTGRWFPVRRAPYPAGDWLHGT